MSKFSIGGYQSSSVLVVYSDREEIELEPDYQRIGGIWTLEKRQLFIDTIINGFDVPKFYFHSFVPPKQKDGRLYRHAIIDGKQRLQAIWDFIDDKLPLADDFTYLHDYSVALGGSYYSTIAKRFPRVKARFDGTILHVVTITTDDTEVIEDLFSRLNEAVPLNAPEKRSAFGGPLPDVIRKLSQHAFFTDRVPFPDGRYRHRDLAAKFLYIEHLGEVVNTKKSDLDRFVRVFKTWRSKRDRRGGTGVVDRLVKITKSNLSLMSSIFGGTMYFFDKLV